MWKYKNKILEEVPENAIGFVYKISFNKKGSDFDGFYYIGYKLFNSKRTKSIGKKRIALLKDKRKSKKETIIKESDWKSYIGSCRDANYKSLWITNSVNFKKEILQIVYTGDYPIPYYEQKHMILENWESPKCFNGNFNGKYFKPCMKD